MRTLVFLTILLLSQHATFAGFSFTLSNPTGETGTSITRDLFVTGQPGDNFTSLTQSEFNLSAGAGATISGFTIDPSMSGSFFLFPASTATVTGGGTGLNGRLYANSPGTASVANQVRLGQLTLLLGAPGNALLTFSDPGATPVTPGGQNVNVNTPFRNVDSDVFSAPQNVVTVVISPAAVPEPSSLILLAAGTALFAFRRRFKKLGSGLSKKIN